MASGDTLIVWTALNGEPTASAFAQFDERNMHPVLDFGDSSNESIMFTGVMPQHYGGGGVTVYIHYAMSTATSGDVDWDGYRLARFTPQATVRVSLQCRHGDT